MKSSVILRILSAAGLACGGMMLASASLAKPAYAQLTESDRVGIPSAPQSSVITLPTAAAGATNEASSDQVDGGEAVPTEPVTPSSPPLPEAGMQAIATAIPINGLLSVAIVNNTGTAVIYEVIGDDLIGNTKKRSLLLNESAVLRNVPLPITVTVAREDRELVDVTATSFEKGILEISLEPDPSPNNTQGTIRIQADGQVLAN